VNQIALFVHDFHFQLKQTRQCKCNNVCSHRAVDVEHHAQVGHEQTDCKCSQVYHDRHSLEHPVFGFLLGFVQFPHEVYQRVSAWEYIEHLAHHDQNETVDPRKRAQLVVLERLQNVRFGVCLLRQLGDAGECLQTQNQTLTQAADLLHVLLAGVLQCTHNHYSPDLNRHGDH